jgi:hypothetical protein
MQYQVSEMKDDDEHCVSACGVRGDDCRFRFTSMRTYKHPNSPSNF